MPDRVLGEAVAQGEALLAGERVEDVTDERVVRRRRSAAFLPALDQPGDVPALGVGELHLREQPPRLLRVVVRDRRLEPLAPRRRLAQLTPQPAQKAHRRLVAHHGSNLTVSETIGAAASIGAARPHVSLRDNGGMKEILPEIERWRREGERVVVATVVATRRSAPRPVGSSLAISESGKLCGSVSGGCVEGDVYEQAQEVLRGGEPKLLSYGISDDEAWSVGLPCGGEIDVFVERL